jgi:hypothetical protein
MTMEHTQLQPPVRQVYAEANRERLDAPAPVASAHLQQTHAHRPSSSEESPLQGLSLAGAAAALGGGHTLIADYIMGADASLAQIRVIDPTTRQVVASSPPDTIARIQQEMLAYQNAAKGSAPSAPPSAEARGKIDPAPPEIAQSAE